MHFISQELEEYIEQHSEKEPALLAALNKETYQKILLPRMLSGHFQGRVLSMLSKLIRPVTILEIGTYTGYSALCLCEGMQKTGQLHTIDIKEELVDFQRKHFDKSSWGKQIFQHLGEAIDIIPTLNVKFDLVFIDADKPNNARYYDLVFEKVRPGGFIMIDNVLWSGKATIPYEEADKDTRFILDFNRKVHQDTRVENVLLPIRDGLMVVRKKK